MRRVAAAGAVDHEIAKVNHRLAGGALRRRLILDVIEARAQGNDSDLEKTGIVVKTFRRLGSGKDAEIVTEYKVDVALLAEWRKNDRHVAEQLHQLGIDVDQGSRSEVLIRKVVIEVPARKYLPAPMTPAPRAGRRGDLATLRIDQLELLLADLNAKFAAADAAYRVSCDELQTVAQERQEVAAVLAHVKDVRE